MSTDKYKIMEKKVTNYNQLEAKSLQLIIDRLPNVTYFCTSASIPGVSTNAARQYSPFSDIKVTGDNLTFQPLIINFLVNENMDNWKEMFNWFVSYAHPTSFEEYKDDSIPQKQLYSSKKSNATLIIPNNKYNITHEFTFIDVIPIDMSDIVIDTQIADTPNIICTVTLECTNYFKSK